VALLKPSVEQENKQIEKYLKNNKEIPTPGYKKISDEEVTYVSPTTTRKSVRIIENNPQYSSNKSTPNQKTPEVICVSPSIPLKKSKKKSAPNENPTSHICTTVPLNEDDIAILKLCFKNKDTMNETLFHTYGSEILTAKDLFTLKGKAWLNDGVIEPYMKLLRGRDKALCAANPLRKPTAYLSCFLMTMLEHNPSDYFALRKWSSNIFSNKNVMLPYNLNGNHWILLVLSTAKKEIRIYDSLIMKKSLATRQVITKKLKILLGWVNYVRINKGDGNEEDVREWNFPFEEDMPKQSNGHDCGVFTLMYAAFLTEDLALVTNSFNQQDANLFRQKMAMSLIRNKLF
jgi:sentrin-specific protease 1